MNTYTPTAERLTTLFEGVHTVVIKNGGVYNNNAIGNEVVLTLSSSEKIIQFISLLMINEPQEKFYCMCVGSYAIELHTNQSAPQTIGFHHGYSIRYHKWNSDAELSNREALLYFLSDEGFAEPLADYLKENKTVENIRKRNWLYIAPKCFSRYDSVMNNFGEQYLSSLMEDLTTEIPDRSQMIIALLQTFGKTDQFWSDYPIYEEIPARILQTIEFNVIIAAYENSDKNYKTRRGLGRFLCSHEFKKQRKKYLASIPATVIEDVLKCFVAMGEEQGILKLRQLEAEKMR